MNSTMSDPELSKRIDDLHRRFDDSRADQLQFRQEVQASHASLRQEIGQLRLEMGQLRESQDRKFTLMIQLMSVGLTLLALLMTAYRFLRL